MTLRGAPVLVTGAGGFVGAWLVRALAARGATAHGYGFGEGAPEIAPECWHAGDVLDVSALETAVARAVPAAVVHLAAQSSAAASFESPVETFRANVVGTRRVLEVMRRAAPRARVLIVASSEVYGPTAEGTRTDESAPFRPVSPYALSKVAADRLAAAVGEQHGLDVVRARSFGHAGPGQSPGFVIAGWAQQIAAIERGEAEPVLRVGNLEVTRDLTDVRDVVDAYLALLERGKRGASYNVCRGEGVRLSQVAARMVALASVPVRIEVEASRLRPADVPYLVGDPGAIGRDTGWRAGRTLDETLRDVLAWWRERPREGPAS